MSRADRKTKKEVPSVLLLGMVFAHQAIEPKRGQEFRDRVRCEAVKACGYNVYTLDDKHEDHQINEHCQANFADTRRMMQSIRSKWSEQKVAFRDIILDYFFSPVGWARCRWNSKFFSATLPAFAQEDLLEIGGKIWLPHLDCIQEQLDNNKELLNKYFEIETTSNCDENPLYAATDNVESELLRCPDILTNVTQVRPLLDHSDKPFYKLTLRADWKKLVSAPSTPIKTSKVNPNRKRNRKIMEETLPILSESEATANDSSAEDLLASPVKKHLRPAKSG